VVVHPDHDERGVRGGCRERPQRLQIVVRHQRLIDHDHRGLRSGEESEQVGDAGRCGYRSSPWAVFEELAQSRADAGAPCGDEHWNHVGSLCRNGLWEHMERIGVRGRLLIGGGS
jgi:hypothetical protein